MKLNMLDAALKRSLKGLTATGQQTASKGGTCQSCRQQSEQLLNGFCANCLKPCDLASGHCGTIDEDQRRSL